MYSQPGADELVRSSQKDTYYINWLNDASSDISRSIVGSRLWIRWRRELQILTELAYFGLSTLSGYQTLGEEYCYIIQVDSSQKSIPSFSRRLLMILLNTLAPYLLEKLLSKLEKEIRSPTLFVFRQIHTISFYFNGVFYHVAKRFTSIKHLLIRETSKDKFAVITYKILGWLSFIQFMVSISQWLLAYVRPLISQNKSQLSTSEGHLETVKIDHQISTSINIKCCLCLESCENPTCTPCGHIFCWHCIAGWCKTKAECPLCRERTEASRLVHLHHYNPT